MPETDIVVGVIEALARSDNVDPAEIGFNLADHMDPEVLVRLGALENAVWEFTFRVSDHQVRITHVGTIFIDGVKHESSTPLYE